ncbi:MAG: hypothetical protein R3F43_13940 [bacterium]
MTLRRLPPSWIAEHGPGAHLLLVALATTTAWAGPAADEAERLFQEGNRAARRQRWPQALAAWQASEALVPAWQPAFNQATVLVFTGQPLAAWAACGRALEREPPADRRAQVEAECGAIEAKLLASYAAIALEVAPADAVVRLDGAPWLPPAGPGGPRRERAGRGAARLPAADADVAPPHRPAVARPSRWCPSHRPPPPSAAPAVGRPGGCGRPAVGRPAVGHPRSRRRPPRAPPSPPP